MQTLWLLDCLVWYLVVKVCSSHRKLNTSSAGMTRVKKKNGSCHLPQRVSHKFFVTPSESPVFLAFKASGEVFSALQRTALWPVELIGTFILSCLHGCNIYIICAIKVRSEIVVLYRRFNSCSAIKESIMGFRWTSQLSSSVFSWADVSYTLPSQWSCVSWSYI